MTILEYSFLVFVFWFFCSELLGHLIPTPSKHFQCSQMFFSHWSTCFPHELLIMSKNGPSASFEQSPVLFMSHMCSNSVFPLSVPHILDQMNNILSMLSFHCHLETSPGFILYFNYLCAFFPGMRISEVFSLQERKGQ